MTGVLFNSKRRFLSLACAVGLFAVTAGVASGQSFGSYDSNHVELMDGYTFSINGVAQTDLSNLGVNGTYEFGFANSGPIHLKILAGSTWGPAGTIVTIGAMSEFGIVASSGLTFDFPTALNLGNTITDYNGNTDTPWGFSPMNSANNGGVYDAGSFGA